MPWRKRLSAVLTAIAARLGFVPAEELDDLRAVLEAAKAHRSIPRGLCQECESSLQAKSMFEDACVAAQKKSRDAEKRADEFRQLLDALGARLAQIRRVTRSPRVLEIIDGD